MSVRALCRYWILEYFKAQNAKKKIKGLIKNTVLELMQNVILLKIFSLNSLLIINQKFRKQNSRVFII